MVVNKWLVGFCAAGVIMMASTSTAMAQNLVRAEFVSHTNDDDKDHDSAVYVEVNTADMKTLLAEVIAGDANKKYPDNSDNTLGLVVKSPGSTKPQCEKFVFRIGMKPNGSDCWRFRGKVILTFDNGTTLVQEIGDTELKGKNNLVWTGWAGGK